MKGTFETGQLANNLRCEGGRRGRQDIIMGILRMAKHGETRAHMVKNLNLSSGQCNKYLVDLKKTGYISEKSGIWETTEKGSQVIDACVICHNLMKLTQQDS